MLRIVIYAGPVEARDGVIELASSFWLDDDGLHLRTPDGIKDFALGSFDGVHVTDA